MQVKKELGAILGPRRTVLTDVSNAVNPSIVQVLFICVYSICYHPSDFFFVENYIAAQAQFETDDPPSLDSDEDKDIVECYYWQ